MRLAARLHKCQLPRTLPEGGVRKLPQVGGGISLHLSSLALSLLLFLPLSPRAQVHHQKRKDKGYSPFSGGLSGLPPFIPSHSIQRTDNYSKHSDNSPSVCPAHHVSARSQYMSGHQSFSKNLAKPTWPRGSIPSPALRTTGKNRSPPFFILRAAIASPDDFHSRVPCPLKCAFSMSSLNWS